MGLGRSSRWAFHVSAVSATASYLMTFHLSPRTSDRQPWGKISDRKVNVGVKDSERWKGYYWITASLYLRVPECILLVCTYHTVECTFTHTYTGRETKKTQRAQVEQKTACRIIITLCALSCVLILMRSHVYVSKQRGHSDSAGSVMHQQQCIKLYQTYLHQQREPWCRH